MISKEDIKNLAELARLKLFDAEEKALQKDISNILEYVGQVSAIERKKPAVLTPQRDATSSSEKEKRQVPEALHNVMRNDTLRTEGDPLWGKEEALRAAFPKREGNFNVVRKIIQKDE